MQATAPTAHCVPASARWRSPMWPPSCRPSKYVPWPIRTSARAPRSWRSACRNTPGALSRGGTARPIRCARALPACGCAPRRSGAPPTLLIEWPHGEAAPTKYWLSNVAKTISFRELVDIAKMRWRIERDYQDLKQEIGLGHYEGRGWRGFHHHGTLCIAAYGFLISERETIPPSGPRSARMFAKPAISAGYRPRGAAAAAATPRPQLDRDRPLRNGGCDRQNAATMPLLRTQISTKHATQLMTQ